MIGSLLFNAIGFVWTIVMAVLALPKLMSSRMSMVRHAETWERGLQWLLQKLVGLDYQVRGLDRIPETTAIFAVKHQSAWDTITAHLLVKDPAIALKQELTRVPIFGRCLLHAGMIKLDRGNAAQALRSLIEGGKQAVARGSPILIFPEGTRTPPGEKGRYHPGVAALYKQLGLPVVPVALNSGLYWGRRSFAKRAGTILVEFLEPIPPGLDRRDFMKELEQRIETATTRLIAEAENVDPARP